jgi:hypothetical protein
MTPKLGSWGEGFGLQCVCTVFEWEHEEEGEGRAKFYKTGFWHVHQKVMVLGLEAWLKW